jgi:hypothetical protein
MLQNFPPISHLIHQSRPNVYLSFLTPSLLGQDDFVKSLATAQKILRGFKKLSRKSTMTRPWQECKYKHLSKSEVGETAAGDQKNFTARAISPPKWRMPARDCHETRSDPWCVGQNSSRCSHENLQLLTKSAWWGDPYDFTYLEMKKEQFMTCEVAEAKAATVLSRFRQRSYCLRVGWGEERAGRPHSCSGGLIEGLGWGYKK